MVRRSDLRVSLELLHLVLELPNDVRIVDARTDWHSAVIRGVQIPELLLALEGNVPNAAECTAIVRKEVTHVTLHPVEKK